MQVGRTGVLTPKAVLTPVRLAGTTVTNATLHNQDFITEKDIRIGDTVLVQKAGEIIPEILSVDLTKRPEGTKPYTLPEVCPVCGAPVVRDEDGAASAAPARSVPPSFSGTSPTLPAGTPWTLRALARRWWPSWWKTDSSPTWRISMTSMHRMWPSWTAWGRSRRRI